jgi:hypothetical protein
MILGDHGPVDQRCIHEGRRHAGELHDPVELHGGRAQGEDPGPAAGQVAAEVDQDVQPVGFDHGRHARIVQAGEIPPMVGRGPEPGGVGRRIAAPVHRRMEEDFESIAVVRLQNRRQEVTRRVFPEIGREIADPQSTGPLRKGRSRARSGVDPVGQEAKEAPAPLVRAVRELQEEREAHAEGRIEHSGQTIELGRVVEQGVEFPCPSFSLLDPAELAREREKVGEPVVDGGFLPQRLRGFECRPRRLEPAGTLLGGGERGPGVEVAPSEGDGALGARDGRLEPPGRDLRSRPLEPGRRVIRA